MTPLTNVADLIFMCTYYLRKRAKSICTLRRVDYFSELWYPMASMERSPSWSMAHAWKACKPKGFEGSNPSLSAKTTFYRADPSDSDKPLFVWL